MKIKFIDKQNNQYYFVIDNYSFDNYSFAGEDMSSIPSKSVQYSIISGTTICSFIMKIIKNDQNEFIVQWNETAIKNCSHIAGFKEYIDKTVKLLAFS